ncbi:metallophosphoesterase family protein [Stutzerimonas stutzeri]|uniref:metallophosphoesterase family protein n=1 Tax=Stutzerimonas stutzeri TaxID=316 RepID=UPI000F79DE21|nr:metallophosphoesterase [Stutzerimonas stutzeri]RRV84488.1 metallophosphoesterase [Stutzerimonas stutzeri]RRW49146.1 metallophosphoesterase [Stutzerimonas stutzeri]
MILLFGDPHGRFDHVHSVVAACRPAALILLGDIEAKRPLEMELAPIADLTQIWFIHGNHDTDSDAFHDNLFCSSLRERNLHGRVVEIDGKRVAGLGGVFRGHVWMPPQPPSYRSPEEFVAMCGKGNRWRGGLPRKHRSTIFQRQVEALYSERADILVTHEAPSAHPHGFEIIDDLARRLRVSKVFHGHHHDRLDYRDSYHRLGFEVHGVGLRGVTDCDGRVVIAGEFDSKY